ncbi:PQQ-binding-like beta-propeller repeat protein [Isoptericola sp. NPDC019693]|uniref:outer membrane protein assembly factor BamB family protein n=1 Tax=Isoptericola sp. NPDC019693 TaxID=3364009 RepID=UPI003798375F
MPPRFRRPEPMTTFELVPDDEPEDMSGSAADDAEPGPRLLSRLRERGRARWRTLSRRGRAAVAAGTAVVVVAAATAVVAPGLLDARAERLRAEAVQGLPGAVGNLSEPLAETWDLANASGALVALSGGTLLTTDATSVSALDAGTGEEVWHREIGTYPTCGPQEGYPIDLGPPADVVVCLSGDGDDRTVTVLDATGTVVGERSIGPARADPYDDGTGATPGEAPVVVPAGGGALAVVEGITDTSAPWPSDDLPDADTLGRLRADGWEDPTLRVEDALTGELRGEASLQLRPQDLAQCGMTQDQGSDPELILSPSVSATSSLVTLSVCGAAVLVTSDGVVVDTGSGGAWARPLPGGGTVVVGEESTVLGRDGDVVTTLPGFLIPPTVDDDPDGPYLVLAGAGTAGGQFRLAAVGADGDEAWSAPVPEPGGVLARVSGVVVVQDGDALVALDAATGTEVWVREDLLRPSGYGSGDWVAGAVTDGTRLLVGIGGDGARHRLVTLDLRDGSTVWQREGQGYLERLQSVDGHVVAAYDGVPHGLG